MTRAAWGAENVFNVVRRGRDTARAPRGAATGVANSYRQLPANQGTNNTGPEKLKCRAINR